MADQRATKRARMDAMTFGQPGEDRGEQVHWDEPIDIDVVPSPVIPEFLIPEDSSSDNPDQAINDACAGNILSMQKDILWMNLEFRYSLLLFYMNKEGISADLMKKDYSGFEIEDMTQTFKQWFLDEGEQYDEFYEEYWKFFTKDRKRSIPPIPNNPFTVEHHFLDPADWGTDRMFWINIIFLWTNQISSWYNTHLPGIDAHTATDVEDDYRQFDNYNSWETKHNTDELIMAASFILWLDEDIEGEPFTMKRKSRLVMEWQEMNHCTPTIGNGVPAKLRAFANQGIFFFYFYFLKKEQKEHRFKRYL